MQHAPEPRLHRRKGRGKGWGHTGHIEHHRHHPEDFVTCAWRSSTSARTRPGCWSPRSPTAALRRRARAPDRGHAAGRGRGPHRPPGGCGDAARVRHLRAISRSASTRSVAERVIAVLTSAVRDAANGEEFRAELRAAVRLRGADHLGRGRGAAHLPRRHELARTRRAAAGARHRRRQHRARGRAGRRGRVLRLDPDRLRALHRALPAARPAPEAAVAACREAVRAGLEEAVPVDVRGRPADGIAVAGTPTSFAAIELRLEPYDRERVHGHRLTREACERILARAGRAAALRAAAGAGTASRSRARRSSPAG